jgi:hypothetical protein
MTEIHFINVGYGDAALVTRRAPDRRPFAMLVDCGGETSGGADPPGCRVTPR